MRFGSGDHSPNIVTVIKSRRLRWEWHVVRMEVGRSVFKILTGKSTGKDINKRNCIDLAQDRDYWNTSGFPKPWSWSVQHHRKLCQSKQN